ncbi:uncharacterized protein LOC143599174 [Bidens hawaiensis]|uniref:uncharacterized protein LOC143599174 n=1 Tax=Bidens hawaiensis TaxID=980011 RepID=UPI0040496C1F
MAEPTSAVQTQPTPIPIFKGDGYEYWCIRMKTILRSRDLWDLIETGVNLADTDQNRLKTVVKKDAHAMAIIQQAVNDQLISRIAGASTAKETWDILKMEFQGEDQVKAVKLQGLRKDFENLSKKDGELVGDYFSRVMAIIIVEKVLRSLSPRFDVIAPSIEVSMDLSKLTPVKFMGALQSQETRLNSRINDKNEKVDDKALQVMMSNTRISSPRGRGRGAGRGRGPHRGNGPANIPQCHVCKKYGHLKRDCWYNEDAQAQIVAEETQKDEARVEAKVEENPEEPRLLMMFTADQDDPANNQWYLDSGCSNHMTGMKECFTFLDENVKLKAL